VSVVVDDMVVKGPVLHRSGRSRVLPLEPKHKKIVMHIEISLQLFYDSGGKHKLWYIFPVRETTI